jgi:ribosomal protein S18 acetylase RimI-like enzyme
MRPSAFIYRLRPSTAADEPWLEQLRRDVYRDVFVRTIGAWDEARHARHCTECLARGNIQIIELDGQLVGMIQLHASDDAVEIGEIQLVASQQRRGLGSQLLTDVVADAHQQHRSVRLSVALKNDGAHRLYRRLGFLDVSRSNTHFHMEHPPPRRLGSTPVA